MKHLILLIIFVIIPAKAFAFEGDYVWEEKFNRMLPKAKGGDIKAQYAIGDMYNRGRGVSRDPARAFQWFSKAANQGNKKAAYKIGYAFLKGKGVSINFIKAMKWLTFSSKKGYERAHFYLGEIYELGIGVDKDLKLALSWYKKADNGGFNPASKRVTRVKRTLAVSAKPKKPQKSLAPPNIRKRVTKIQKIQVKVRKVSLKSPSVLSTKDKILRGGWKKRGKPSEYLPSPITSCKKIGNSIECLSKKQSRSIGMAIIRYTTKAIVFAIKPTGSFKISYRNNVMAVDITDPEFAESGSKVPVKTGWQDAKHTLVCVFEDNNAIACKKNKIRNLKFKR